jgi:mannosyltransferase OCH1-like enzyme
MNDNHVIQSLWIGPALSPMERLGINSFLRHGHEFHLYTYTPVGNVPQGVTMRDAREIIPLSLVDYTKFPRLAIFADLFRYKLLLDKGGWWVDTDTVCMRPFDFPEEYVFSSEVKSANRGVSIIGTQVNNGNIKAPAGSPIMRHCWEQCSEMVRDPGNVKWSTTGPMLIEPAVKQFGLERYVQPPQALCPVMAWDARKLTLPVPLAVSSTAYAVHLWNEIWKWEKLDKQAAFPPACAYEQLKRRFIDRGAPNTVQSLWVGGRLSNMEKLSIASYLHYGEHFHLYTYEPVEGIPEGTVVKDANEIVPQSDIAKFQNMANFSDWFRYNLLHKKGNWWVDIDTVLLKPFDFGDEHVFVNQYPDLNHKDQVNGDYIKAPVGSPVMKWLIDKCWRMDWKRIEWSDIGPNLVTEAVRNFSITPLNSSVSFNPWSRACVEGTIRAPESAYAIHLVRNNWRGRWDTGNPLDLDATYPKGCLYEQLKDMYTPAPGADTQLGAPWLGEKHRIVPNPAVYPATRAPTHLYLPRNTQRGKPVLTAVGASADWKGTLIGAKVNHAMAKGFTVTAICPIDSSYYKEIKKMMPTAIEEIVETPTGKRVLFLVR